MEKALVGLNSSGGVQGCDPPKRLGKDVNEGC